MRKVPRGPRPFLPSLALIAIGALYTPSTHAQGQGVVIRVTLAGRADSVFGVAVWSADARGFKLVRSDSVARSATFLSPDSVSLRLTVRPSGDSSEVTMLAAPDVDNVRALRALFGLSGAIRPNVVSVTPVGPVQPRRP